MSAGVRLVPFALAGQPVSRQPMCSSGGWGRTSGGPPCFRREGEPLDMTPNTKEDRPARPVRGSGRHPGPLLPTPSQRRDVHVARSKRLQRQDRGRLLATAVNPLLQACRPQPSGRGALRPGRATRNGTHFCPAPDRQVASPRGEVHLSDLLVDGGGGRHPLPSPLPGFVNHHAARPK